MNIQTINPFTNGIAKLTSKGLQDNSGNLFPFHDGAYRIVNEHNYTDNFGYQWNKFITTQIDSAADFDLTRKRFFSVTGWDKQDLSGKNILEVGSGAGRFTQIV